MFHSTRVAVSAVRIDQAATTDRCVYAGPRRTAVGRARISIVTVASDDTGIGRREKPARTGGQKIVRIFDGDVPFVLLTRCERWPIHADSFRLIRRERSCWLGVDHREGATIIHVIGDGKFVFRSGKIVRMAVGRAVSQLVDVPAQRWRIGLDVNGVGLWIESHDPQPTVALIGACLVIRNPGVNGMSVIGEVGTAVGLVQVTAQGQENIGSTLGHVDDRLSLGRQRHVAGSAGRWCAHEVRCDDGAARRVSSH